MSENIPTIDASESVCGMNRAIIKNLCNDLQERLLDCENSDVLSFTADNLNWVIKQFEERRAWEDKKDEQ